MPLLTEIKQEPYLSVVVWRIADTEVFSPDLLSSDDLKMLGEITSPLKKSQFLASRHVLINLLNCGSISYNSNGKPFATNKHISNSHSGNFIAAIGSDEGSVGVDIQVYTSKIEKIKSRFLSEAEDFYSQSVKTLTLAWSLKESLYKIRGTPEIFFKEHIRLGVPQKTAKGEYLVNCEVLHKKYKTTYLMKALVENDYCLAFGPVPAVEL